MSKKDTTTSERTPAQLEQQRKRSIAIGLALAALMLMFYAATWVRFANLVSG